MRNFIPGMEQTGYAILLTSFVMGVARSSDSLLSRALSFRPIVWLGERSYGMYLSHLAMWPLSHWLGLDGALWKLFLTITLSCLLWETVEKPTSRFKPDIFTNLKKEKDSGAS
jgi:peptidoglycan/LPS O-acetylase OafA/YrhL